MTPRPPSRDGLSTTVAPVGGEQLVLRPVRPEDGELEACAEIWRRSIDDYITRLGQPELPTEVAALLRLYRHLQATDPERFVVALDGDRPVAFAAAVVRERLWFLSMCFVLPEIQARGIGRRLLDAVGAGVAADTATGVHAEDRVRATATDSGQPISNALYASLGIVPRVPLLNLIGPQGDTSGFGPLPSGVRPVPFEDVVALGADGSGHRQLATAVDELDRSALGVAHPLEHRFLRQEGRRGWLYHGPDGAPVAYGYATEAGRVGPIAVRDERLLTPILGHLMREVAPRGAFAMWLPGSADRAVVAALAAGFRLDAWPVLLCWDRPFVDLSRYLPISPGLL